VFDRASLSAGLKLDGPAVDAKLGSTTVDFRGQRLRVDPHGILIIQAADKAANKKS